MPSQKIKLMLADDHRSALEAYSRVLEAEPNFDVIGLALNGEELLKLIGVNVPDIVLLDIDMPVLNGFETLKRINTEYPGIKTIMLSTHSEKLYISHFLLNGARAYLPKACGIEEIIITVNGVYNDDFYLDYDLSQAVVSLYLTEGEAKKITTAILSEVEIETLTQLCDGMSNKRIADSLKISVEEVNLHLKCIYKKIDVDSVVPLIKYAIRNGITGVD